MDTNCYPEPETPPGVASGTSTPKSADTTILQASRSCDWLPNSFIAKTSQTSCLKPTNTEISKINQHLEELCEAFYIII